MSRSHLAAQEVRDTIEDAGYIGGFVECDGNGTTFLNGDCRNTGAHTFGVTIAGERFAVTVSPWTDRRHDG